MFGFGLFDAGFGVNFLRTLDNRFNDQMKDTENFQRDTRHQEYLKFRASADSRSQASWAASSSPESAEAHALLFGVGSVNSGSIADGAPTNTTSTGGTLA